MGQRGHRQGIGLLLVKLFLFEGQTWGHLELLLHGLRLPEDALEHGECSPEIRTADLHCEDTGAHDPVADADQDPETRNMISVWSLDCRRHDVILHLVQHEELSLMMILTRAWYSVWNQFGWHGWYVWAQCSVWSGILKVGTKTNSEGSLSA